MVNLSGDKKANVSQSYSRRDFLRIGSLVLGGLTLGNYMKLYASGQVKSASAKSVIYIFLDGGPAQTDMFDPKPTAGRDYFGAFKQPLPSKVDGLFVGEKLPLLAGLADKYTVIRSMTHGFNGHETAQYVMQTGTQPGGQLVYPSYGAVVAYKKDQDYKGDLPSFIAVTSPSTRFNEAGFLGPKYKPFATGGSPEDEHFDVEGIINGNVSDEQLRQRKDLLHSLDSLSYELEKGAETAKFDTYHEQAYSLILGNSRKAFELNLESAATCDRYGRTRLGQSCLLARRLVEYGVPFVTVRYSGWDTHKEHFERMNEKLPELDKAVSALIEDLHQRGLLDQTIVLCGGEFGRTPKISWEPPWNGGRQHFSTAFSYLVAGGGFAAGKIIGETDAKGEKILSRPVYPWDLTASVYQLLGIDPNGTLPHPQGGFAQVLPDFANQKNSGGILKEIMG